MPEQATGTKVVIVGAGVTGVVSAYELAEDHDVTVIDKGMVASDTTARASGFLATPPTYPELPSVGEHAMEFFREFDGTGVYTFRECPTIHVVSEEDVEKSRGYAEKEQSAGRPVTFLTTDEVKEEYGGQFDLSGCGGALIFENTGYTNPFDFAISLKHIAEERGAEIMTDTTVQDVVVEDDEVEGVKTRHGVIEADHVVVATGWRTHDLLEDIVEVPVKPARWESVIVDPKDDLDATYPMGTDWVKQGIYWRPTPEGHLLIGGNPIPVENKGETQLSVTDRFLNLVTDHVPSLISAADDAEVVRDECCPTGAAGTPDTMPIIDAPEDAPDGLVIAAGFQRGGILTAPVTGTAVRSLITGANTPFPMEPFALSRFDSRSPDFEIVSYLTRGETASD